jgi:hypothetical protein
VWDTVGSYGIPAGIGLGALSRFFTAWLLHGFHDTQIGKHIEIGLHAVAVDEKRRAFAPTFWTIPKGEEPQGHVEQTWFVGAHANIGGSYLDTGLSDTSLIWMISRITEVGQSRFGSTLEFNEDVIREHTKPTLLGVLYRSERGWLIGSLFPYDRPVLAPNAIEVRAVLWNGENPKERHINGKVHWSVVERFDRSAPVDGKKSVVYRPRNLPKFPIPNPPGRGDYRKGAGALAEKAEI